MAEEEAPKEEGAENGAEAGKKKSKKKLIIIIVAAVVLLGGGGAGAYFAGLFGGEKHAEGEEAEGGEHADGAEGEHGEDGEHGEAKNTYFELPQFLVNLNTGGKQTSFLKMTVALELKKAEDVPTVQANLPRVMDALNTYLRELRASDLYGSAGIYRLREEILTRINEELKPLQVKRVLFKELLVQ